MLRSIVCLAIAATAATATAAANPTVALPSGATVTGLAETAVGGKSVHVFRGIPYADAPIGDRRWMQSTLKPPTGSIKATTFGNVCLGDARYDPTYGQFPISEDCLFLNIFAPPNASSTAKLPVMVWIHGGAYVAGSSSAFDARNLVAAANDQQLIVVTLNYRLGVFGFLSNREILQQGDGANFGFRDQEVAFQWVQKYIAYFGGDPDNITAFGESAGAMSVAMHMISRGGDQQLFHKGILESGAYAVTHDTKTLDQLNEYMGILAAGVGCTDAPGGVTDCLRRANASAIFSVGGWLPWRPTVDGVFLRDAPIQRVMAGKISSVPTIVGVNTDEGWMFTYGFADAAQFDIFLRVMYPLLTEAEYARVAALYPADRFATAQHRVGEIFGDVTFVCPSETLSLALAARPATRTFRYRYNQTALVGGVPLALHTAELDYVFNNVDMLPKDEGTTSLVATIQRFWINFATTGDPNDNGGSGSSGPVCGVWPAYDGLTQRQVILQAAGSEEERMGAYMRDHERRCAFWRAVDLRIAEEVAFK